MDPGIANLIGPMFYLAFVLTKNNYVLCLIIILAILGVCNYYNNKPKDMNKL